MTNEHASDSIMLKSNTRKVGRTIIGVLGFLAFANQHASGEIRRDATGFAAQVDAQFDHWDRDRDGSLSFLETSYFVPDVAIRGEAAAALAAIHLAQRGARWHLAGFTRNDLLAAFDGTERLPPFEAYHRMCLAHIVATGRELFVDGEPDLSTFHQGPLGDCYFVATLGALVDRDPTAVGRIVRRGMDGSYAVRFPDGEPVRVRQISDAEIALGSYNAGHGLWLNVLEKAYGELVQRALARRGMDEDAIDALGNGGTPTGAVSLFTGCDAALLRFRPAGTPMLADDFHVSAFLPMARSLLTFNLRQPTRRLTCCSTTTAETPPGIARGHLFAVLGFDPDTDVVHLWNPWGNDFQPSGPAGVEAGYPARQGRFDVPLRDFIRIFDAVAYQTDRPESLD